MTNLQTIEALDWRVDAACRDSDPDEWFPNTARCATMAKRICKKCPVMWECRAYSLVRRLEYGQMEPEGIWGGLTNYARCDRETAERLLDEALSHIHGEEVT